MYIVSFGVLIGGAQKRVKQKHNARVTSLAKVGCELPKHPEPPYYPRTRRIIIITETQTLSLDQPKRRSDCVASLRSKSVGVREFAAAAAWNGKVKYLRRRARVLRCNDGRAAGGFLGVDPIEKMAGRRRQRWRADGGVCCAGWWYIFDRELRTAAEPMQPYRRDTKYRVYTLYDNLTAYFRPETTVVY